MLRYQIKATPDDNGTLLVVCPTLPEVTTFGATEAEAAEHAADAIVEALAGRMAHNLDIPGPDADGIAVPSRVAMKVLVYQAMRREGITKYRLTKMLGSHPPQIDRRLDVRHNTNLDALDAAMRALDGAFVIEARLT